MSDAPTEPAAEPDYAFVPEPPLVTILCLAASVGFAVLAATAIAFVAIGVGFAAGVLVGRVRALTKLRSGARPAPDAPMQQRIPFLVLACGGGAVGAVILGLAGLSRFQMGVVAIGLLALIAGAYIAIILSGAIDFAITRGPIQPLWRR